MLNAALLLALFAPAPLENSADGEDLVRCRWVEHGGDLYSVRFGRDGGYEVRGDDEGVRWAGEWWADGRVIRLRESQWRRFDPPVMGWYRQGASYNIALELRRTNRPGVLRGRAWGRESTFAETRP